MAKKEPVVIDVSEAKKWLRRALVRIRQSIPEKKRRLASRRMLEHLTRSPQYKQAQVIATFLGFGSEVHTEPIVEHAWKAGKKVLIPITTNGFERPFFALFRKGDELHSTKFGPREHKKKVKAHDFREIDLVIVPGLGFDQRGIRLGYGGGVYDRMLEKIPNADKIGLFFADQYLPFLPAQKHDKPLDGIFTEKGLFKPKN